MNTSVKIAIVGYGKMGREIERICRETRVEITAVIDNQQDWKEKEQDLRKADVAIEFTSPAVVKNNIRKLLDMGIPVVTGTTGWYDAMEEIRNYCETCNGSLFYASNFSIGVNLFFALNRHLAKIMADYPEYQLHMEETHHTQKLDAPSGTAITLAEGIMQENTRYTGWKLDSDDVQIGDIPVTAHRIEGVTGTHVVNYQSPVDTISIQHIAHKREGFARGALMAAKWLNGRKGIFSMNDMLNL